MNTWLFLGSLLLALAGRAQGLPTPAQQAQSVADFQRQLNQEFSSPLESPLSAAERASFQGLPFYPVAYSYCVVAQLVRDSTSRPFGMATSNGQLQQYRRYGELHFELHGQPLRLAVYQSLRLLTKPGFADYLLVPFTDLTNGHGSYGAGRYLDFRIPPPGVATLVLDFNKAYNPSCAYSAGYACPVPPAENRLAVAIPAGVQSSR